MRKHKNFWDKNAGRYDRLMRKDRAAYEEMYALIRPVVNAKTVLELATGTGLIAKHIFYRKGDTTIMIDAGYNYDRLAVKSLTLLEKQLRKRGLHPLFITGHTGWTDNMDFAFAHKNELCSPFKKRVHDPNALYDAYDESDDTEENSKSGYLKGVGR